MIVRLAARHVTTFFALPLSFALAFSAACASTEKSDNASATDTTEPPDAGTRRVDSGAADTGKDDDTAPQKDGDEACADKGAQACQTCCSQGHQKGYQAYLGALLACACGSGSAGDAGAGACATECKTTVCAATPANPDATCNTCLESVLADQSAACVQPVTTACQSEKDCVALLTCAQGCPTK